MLSDWVSSREEASGTLLVHDGHGQTSRPVFLREETPGIVGLILFFFFTAHHPKKRAHSPLLEAVRGLRFPTPSQGIDGLRCLDPNSSKFRRSL